MEAAVLTPQTNTERRFKARPANLNGVETSVKTDEYADIVNCPSCNNELELGETEPVLCPFCGFDLETYEDNALVAMMEEALKEPGFVSMEEVFEVLRR